MIKLEELKTYREQFERHRATVFADWPVEPEVREACSKVLADSMDELIALGPDGTEVDAAEILRRCIEAYDDLDDGFIGTLEREGLCEILYEVGDLSGMDPEEDWVDETRDW